MCNLHQQAAQQAQHAPDYRPSFTCSHWPSAWLVRAVVGTGAAGWRRDPGGQALCLEGERQKGALGMKSRKARSLMVQGDVMQNLLCVSRLPCPRA